MSVNPLLPKNVVEASDDVAPEKDEKGTETKVPSGVSSVKSDKEIAKEVLSECDLELESMQDSFELSHDLVLPKLSNGVSIGDANRGRFNYSWLDKSSLTQPMFSGYIPLTKNSAGARDNEGNFIPNQQWVRENEYDSTRHIIRRGSLILCFCKASFKKAYDKAIYESNAKPFVDSYARHQSASRSGNDVTYSSSIVEDN